MPLISVDAPDSAFGASIAPSHGLAGAHEPATRRPTMGTAIWQPKWWDDKQHGSAWTRVKEAMKRDWDQTKKDLHVGGKELDQNVGDTVNQAAGKERIPGPNTPNSIGTRRGTDLTWDEAEQPLMYGVGARQQYGNEHPHWNDKLEDTLRKDWERADAGVKRAWDDVKNVVHHGYDRARS
jgi:hypothetical protein